MRRKGIRVVAGVWAVWCLCGLTSRVGLAQSLMPGFLAGDYHADVRFPEYMRLWREGWKWVDRNGKRVRYAREGMPLGGYLFAYIQNATDRTLEIEDIRLDGVSVAQAVARAPKGGTKYASSLYFSKLPAAQITTLKQLGEPVWWKVDPQVLAPGQMAQAVVRLRRDPKADRVTVSLVGGDVKMEGVVDLTRRAPRVVGISFSPGLDTVFLYLKHPRGGIAPDKILLDGRSVTAQCAIAADPAVEIVPAVIRLPQPLEPASFHVFHAWYADGSLAVSAIRVWKPDFLYGMWGYPKKTGSPEKAVPAYLKRLHLHNINLIAGHFGGEVRKYVRSLAGQALCRKLGIEIIDHNPKGFGNQRYNFLMDEPDAGDIKRKSIRDPRQRLGCLGQYLVDKSWRWRREDPDVLQMLNVDNTYKPEQWYMYAQLPDVPCTDPYYLGQLRGVYRDDPELVGAYAKPTYVYAAGCIYGSACVPKPMHVILQSVGFSGNEKEKPFRGPTPLEKRVEVYYALAAGAKNISYWWYTPVGKHVGCGADTPAMQALMREIGLLGAEVRTAEPVLSRACPVELLVEASPQLWVRTLLAGDDTVVVLVVNDTIHCDRRGARVTPLNGARFRVKLPAWLKVADCFELTCRGVGNLPWRSDEGRLQAELGTVNATRMILVTRNSGLRAQLRTRYETQFADNVRRLLAGGKAGR